MEAAADHCMKWMSQMRVSICTAGLTGVVLLVALLACSSGMPNAQDRPDGDKTVRKIQREPTTEVVVDERFFKPFFLGDDAPKVLRQAYKDYIKGDTGKAKTALLKFVKANPNHDMEPRAQFLLASLQASAKEYTKAATRFEELAERYPLLADHAWFQGAQAAFKAKNYKQVVRLCKAIPMSSPFGARSKHLRGRSLLATGQHKDSVEVFEALLKDYPKAFFSRRVRLDLATAYEKLGRHADAARLYHEVRMRYPGGGLEKEAEAGVTRVSKKLSRKDRESILTPSAKDKVLRASALNDKHRSKQVVAEMSALVSKKSRLKPGSQVWCDASYLLGTAYRKLRQHRDAAAAFDGFIKKCPRHNNLIKALYASGRSLWTVDEDARALKLFERVWTDFPQHSYADDAVLYAAKINRSNKNEAEAARLLKFQVEKFPRGDMLGTAHWMRFLKHYQQGQYTKAIAYADGVGTATGEVDIYTRGRLAYFRARALELSGKPIKARKGFEQVVRKVPMSYYALMAFNRLRELDKSVYEALVGELAASGGQREPWSIEPPQVTEDSRFKRGVELLRLGLFDEARGEFDRLKRRYAGHEQVLWTLTLLFDRAGAYHLSHNIPRRKIGSFGSSYPVGRDLDMYLLAYPRPFLEHVSTWAPKRQIPQALVYASMREESGFNPRIESWANAYGLMQLILPTAKDVASADNLKKPKPSRLKGTHLFDPALNVRLGTRFLGSLHDAYDQHPVVTISGYNGGFGNVDKWLRQRGKMPVDLWVEEIPFGQTRHYTKRVLTSLWIYQWLYSAGAKDAPTADDRIIKVPMGLPNPSK